MNNIERFVYDVVKSNPKLKKQIRNVYQGVFDLLPQKDNFSVNPISLKEGYFLGFHELQPFNLDNSKVLAVKYPYEEIRMPGPSDYASVGYFSIVDDTLGDFVEVGKTNAWNFHKGCRLQWIGSNKIIFNCTENSVLISKIVDLGTGATFNMPVPIDTVSPCGKYATSFSYERLERHMPGYGYCHKDSMALINEKAPSETGLFLLNIDTLEVVLIADLKELSKRAEKLESANEWDHYVTHTEFSHDSKLISFFHRWSGEYKGKRFTEFMLYNLESKSFDRLPTTNLMTSHYDWNNNREIIAYCNFKGQDAHVLFKIDNIDDSHLVAYPAINSDGHQSFISDTTFITDTYPDKWRMSKLYKVDIRSNTKKLVASVKSSKKFQSSPAKGHVACDLHPVVSRDGLFVCFDTVQTGKRALAIMKL